MGEVAGRSRDPPALEGSSVLYNNIAPSYQHLHSLRSFGEALSRHCLWGGGEDTAPETKIPSFLGDATSMGGAKGVKIGAVLEVACGESGPEPSHCLRGVKLEWADAPHSGCLEWQSTHLIFAILVVSEE